MCLDSMFKVLKSKVMDGATQHFLDGTKLNINKFLRKHQTPAIIQKLSDRIVKGLKQL